MFCSKCGNQLNENDSFCQRCGAQNQYYRPQPQNNGYNQYNGGYNNIGYNNGMNNYNNYNNYPGNGYNWGYNSGFNQGYNNYGNPQQPAKQPIAALVVEGFAVLLSIIVGIIMFSLDAYERAKYTGIGIFCLAVGIILFIVSFIMFSSFKKRNALQGIGVAGYVISIIGFILSILLLIFMIFVVLLSAGLVMNITKHAQPVNQIGIPFLNLLFS